MIDIKDFNFLESHNNFDFKGFLLKLVSYWKWFVISILICLFCAYQVNVRKQKIYELDTTIGIKEEDNPLFTSNTSLVFNWGGTSDQVSTIASTLNSRTHNEFVVEKLEYYISYLQQKEYYIEDIYGTCPFKVTIDKKKPQVANKDIVIKFISSSEYQLSIDFESKRTKSFVYSNDTSKEINVDEGIFSKKYKIGQQVVLPFLSWKLNLIEFPENYVGK